MAGIRQGPTQAYANEYDTVNRRIDAVAQALAAELGGRGFAARALAASARTDAANIRGDFPQKKRGHPGRVRLGGPQLPIGHLEVRALGAAGRGFYRPGAPLRAGGEPPFLRPLHPLCRRLPGRGLKPRRLEAGPPPGGNPSGRGLRPL